MSQLYSLPFPIWALRWKKVIRDLWINRGRSLLVIAAVTVGMIGVSIVLCAYAILVRELDANYQRTNPAAAVIVTDSVEHSLLQSISQRPEIEQIEARGRFRARIKIGENEWKTIFLYVADDFSSIKLNAFTSEAGCWPPSPGEILIERAAFRVIGKKIGDTVEVQLPGSPEVNVHISGSVHDPGQAPAWMEGWAYGYISRDTLKLLGRKSLNEVLITLADHQLDKEGIRNVVKSITSQMERDSYRIERIDIPEPGHHPHQSQLQALLFLLQAFGGLSLVLSTVLVATLMNATMTQQIRQIGVMKAIGARRGQVAGMYLGGALILGLVAVALALPVGIVGARAYAEFAAMMLNFNIINQSIPLWAYILLLVIGVLTPTLAAARSIWRGSRITVRDAITDYGISVSSAGDGIIGGKIVQSLRISRPLLLSIRNSFRKKARMALTLGTLIIGGAMFISSLNVGASIKKTISVFRSTMHYDLIITLNDPVPFEQIAPILKNVASVDKIEGWASAKATMIYSDGSDSNTFDLIAPTSDTTMLKPRIEKGRWLTSQLSNGMVVNHIFMDQQPHLSVGDSVMLRINGQQSSWQIIGVIRQIGSSRGFVNPTSLTTITGTQGMVGAIPVVTQTHSLDAHRAAARQFEQIFDQTGIGVQDIVSIYNVQKVMEDHFLVLTMLLLLMAGLIVIVGGLALMTTMSIQVLERTREIGVMRAIGASSRQLLHMIGTEGLVIGILSWILAALLALPLSDIIGDVFGSIFLKTTLDYALTPLGFFLWLGVVIAFSLLAGYFPARKAVRLTVRETLSYE